MHCGNASMTTRERPWLKNCWVTIAPPQDVLVLRSENLAKNPGISSVLVFIVFILGTPWDPWVWCYVGISILMLLRCSFCSVPSQVWFNWHWVQVGAVLVYNASSTATMFHEQLRCLKPSATQFGQISCQQSPLTPIDCTKLAMDTATLKWTTLMNDTVTPHTVTYITMYFSDLAENSGHPEIQNIQHE